MLENVLLQKPFFVPYIAIVIVLSVFFLVSYGFQLKSIYTKILGLLLLVLPVIYFYTLQIAYTINVPNSDDYILFETIYKMRNATSFSGFTSALFEQVNQHRFLFERLIMFTIYIITGTINVPLLITIGNLFILGTAFLFHRVFVKEKLSWYFFIPVVYFLFSFAYAENALWGIAAIQNTPLIFFALLTIYFISQEGEKSWRFALFFALITTFISGSGMLTWIIGALFLGVKGHYKRLVIWIVVAIVTFAFYFLYDYTIIHSENESVLKHPIFNLLLFFGFSGNALFFNIPHPLVPKFYPDLVWCTVLGAAFMPILFFWLIRYFLLTKVNWVFWFLLGGMMFMMGTAAMFVLSRTSTYFFMYGGEMLSLRYIIFGVALLVVMYIATLVMLANYRRLIAVWVGIMLIASILYNFNSYYLNISYARKLHDELALDGYYWKHHQTFLTQGDLFGDIPFWNHPTRMKELVDRVEKAGIVHLTVPEEVSQFLDNKSISYQKFKGNFQVVESDRIGNNNLLKKYIEFKISGEVEAKYIVLKSSNRTLVLPALPVRNTVYDMLVERQYYSPNYAYGSYREKLPKDAAEYETWLIVKSNGGYKYQFIDKKTLL